MAEGHPPLSDMSPAQALYIIPTRDAPRLSSNSFSLAFSEFLKLCLNKDPKKRSSTAELLKVMINANI
jgi:serine/threonine protein kinase